MWVSWTSHRFAQQKHLCFYCGKSLEAPWQQSSLSGAHCNFDEICDMCCGYVLSKGTKQRSWKMWWVFLEPGKSMSAGWGWKELSLLSHQYAWRTEAYSRNPQVHVYRNKIEMLVAGENNSNMLQHLVKMMGKWFATHHKGMGKHCHLLALSCALQLQFTILIHRACRFPFQGVWWWVAAGHPACPFCPYTSPDCPSLVMACAETDLPISQWKQ